MSEFINRRGRHTSVDDTAHVLPSAAVPPAKTTTVTPGRRTRRLRLTLRPLRRIPRLVWMIVASLLVVALIALLLVADSSKRAYERQTAAMKRSVVDISKTTIGLDTSAVDALSRISSRLNVSTDCRPDGLDAASWYPLATQTKRDCQKTATEYRQLQTAVTDMKATAVYIRAVDQALRPALASPSDGEFAAPSDYAGRWQTALDTVKGVKAPSVLQASHTDLTGRIEKVTTLWTQLHQANAGQDAGQFTAVSSELTKAYTELRASSTALDSVVATQQTTIDQLVARL